MFLAGRPTQNVIDRFLRESQDLPFSYGPVGIVRTPTAAQHLDELTVAVGRGQAATLARFGQPIVRALQARFRDHSVAAMKLGTRSSSVPA